jgi:D-serine deaminase-like pyridoxal phosphate-dependent protein
MIEIAGDPSRLRTHVKTHKTAELVNMQLRAGITKFKCATMAEVEMVAATGGKDILLAYPLLGPAVRHFFELRKGYPEVRLSVTVDSATAIQQLAQHPDREHRTVRVFVDLDSGMHRTGTSPDKAFGLIQEIMDEEYLVFEGLHIYDGHIHEHHPVARRKHVDRDFESVIELMEQLDNSGIPVKELACGGTPTFPIHALYKERTLCPGTPLLWDAGYHHAFPDLDFQHAAVLATRVISKPGNHFCLDLGHKAVASEMNHPRIEFLEFEAEEVITHNEEHLAVRLGGSPQPEIGAVVYALPVHICPTMALHSTVYVVEDHQVTGSWKVVARDRDFKATNS